MSKAKTTAVSGCVIWVLLISIISSCVLPVFFLGGMLSSYTTFATDITGKWLCPEGTTPHQNTYSTTSNDEFGNPQPATGFELQCLDDGGTVVKTDPIVYSFLWIGIWSLVGLIVAGVLTMIFAVPGGMLVTRFLERVKVKRVTRDPANP